MIYSIKKRYPELTESDFMIADRSDGKGPVVVYWNSDKPKPTTEQLLIWMVEDANDIPATKTHEQIIQEENQELKRQIAQLNADFAAFMEYIISGRV